MSQTVNSISTKGISSNNGNKKSAVKPTIAKQKSDSKDKSLEE